MSEKRADAHLTAEGQKSHERIGPHDLLDALEKDQLRLYYQPLISAASGEICGVEALVRWAHPSLGLLAPYQFLPQAEESGLISEIGRWVLETACRQTSSWQQTYVQPIHISVNFSAVQFEEQNIVTRVSQLLASTGLEPAYLRVEITESAMLSNMYQAVEVLNQFKSMGIQVVMDDFGTRYSSLEYLKNLPVDVIKIDKMFIREIHLKRRDQQIVRSIIELGHRLEAKVCAEGVEEPAQFELIKELGCDEAQGFLFSPPLPSSQLEKQLQKER